MQIGYSPIALLCTNYRRLSLSQRTVSLFLNLPPFVHISAFNQDNLSWLGKHIHQQLETSSRTIYQVHPDKNLLTRLTNSLFSIKGTCSVIALGQAGSI